MNKAQEILNMIQMFEDQFPGFRHQSKGPGQYVLTHKLAPFRILVRERRDGKECGVVYVKAKGQPWEEFSRLAGSVNPALSYQPYYRDSVRNFHKFAFDINTMAALVNHLVKYLYDDEDARKEMFLV